MIDSETNPKNLDDNSSTVMKSAFGFISGTMLCRITGLLRDMSMAFCFGTGAALAAFLVAFRFAHLLRRIFGEGAMLTSFIPHFESCRKDNPKNAAVFFRDVFFSLAWLLIILIAAIELGLYFWLGHEGAADNRQIILLTMIMLPGLLFICLYSICSGLLHCEKNSFLVGIAPVAFNLVWISAIWFLRGTEVHQAVIGLSMAVTLALLFQWLMTVPKVLSFLFRYISWREFFRFRLFSIEMRKMIASMSIGVIGVSATQINSAIDTLFARYASLEGPAYLNYAIHLEQLPLALFGIGISTVLLPPLSRAIKSADLNRYTQLLHFSFSTTLTFLLPCTMAILVLGGPSVNLIYGRGDFNNESTIQTTLCLWGYGLGLIPMGLILILTPAFYAKHDFWTPTLSCLGSILLNASLNILFVFFLHYQAASLACATSLAAYFNLWLLLKGLARKEEGFKFSLFTSMAKIALCTGIAGVATFSVEYVLFNESFLTLLMGGAQTEFPRHFTQQAAQFSILFCSFVSTFLISAWALKATELFHFIKTRLAT